jgi:hypothetical protein
LSSWKAYLHTHSRASSSSSIAAAAFMPLESHYTGDTESTHFGRHPHTPRLQILYQHTPCPT